MTTENPKARGVIVRTTGLRLQVTADKETHFTYKELEQLVGGDPIQIGYMGDFVLIADRDADKARKYPNATASMEYQTATGNSITLLGDVLIVNRQYVR